MSDVCLTCSGLIMEHGKSYSYAGPICYCFAQPRVQRPSREQTPAAPSAPADWPHAFCPHGVSPASMCAKCARANEPTAPEGWVNPHGHFIRAEKPAPKANCCPLCGDECLCFGEVLKPKPNTFADQRDQAAEDCYESDLEDVRIAFKRGADWANARLIEGVISQTAHRAIVDRLRAELSAYKKAKAENDERFQLEVGQLRALTEADKLEIDGLREENASYRARLEKAEAASEHRYKWAMAQQSRADHALAALEYAKRAIEHEDLSFPHAEESVLAEIERILGES